jgi:polyhydroxyalkanoate synthesis repressor PhaR
MVERSARQRQSADEAASQIRIIKKYPNRRLYDTAISSYIPLEHVKDLVVAGVHFRVVDSRTAEDLTRPILFQIIAEQEQRGAPLFSDEFLVQLIRLYGDTLQEAIRRYFEFVAQMLVDQQSLLRQQLNALLQANPVSMMVDVAQRNLALWTTMQEAMVRRPGADADSPERKDAPPSAES